MSADSALHQVASPPRPNPYDMDFPLLTELLGLDVEHGSTPDVVSIDLFPPVDVRHYPAVDRPPLVTVREMPLLTRPPWVRSLGKWSFDLTTQGWRFPA